MTLRAKEPAESKAQSSHCHTGVVCINMWTVKKLAIVMLHWKQS